MHRAAAALTKIVRAGNGFAVTHGDRPQVGLCALQSGSFAQDSVGPKVEAAGGFTAAGHGVSQINQRS